MNETIAMTRAILAVILTASLSDAQATTDWPNEPAGSALITDNSWDALSGNGWVDVYQTGAVVQNPNGLTAPFTPPNVLQLNYLTTEGADGAAGTYDYPFVSRMTNRLYSAFWFMLSDTFATYATGTKLFFNMQGDGGNYLGDLIPVVNVVNGQVVLRFYIPHQPGAGDINNCHLANVVAGDCPGSVNVAGTVIPDYAVSTGHWHQLEEYLQTSTTNTSEDGVIRVWLDGNLAINYTNVNTDPSKFFDVQVSPSYQGTPPNDSMYIWYDDVHVSAPGGSPPPPVNIMAPAAPRGIKVL